MKKNIFSFEESGSFKGQYKLNISLDIGEYIFKPIAGSWNVIFARTFGVPYDVFLRIVRDNYNGVLRGKTGTYIYFTIEDKESAKRLVDDLNSRWNTIWKNK